MSEIFLPLFLLFFIEEISSNNFYKITDNSNIYFNFFYLYMKEE